MMKKTQSEYLNSKFYVTKYPVGNWRLTTPTRKIGDAQLLENHATCGSNVDSELKIPHLASAHISPFISRAFPNELYYNVFIFMPLVWEMVTRLQKKGKPITFSPPFFNVRQNMKTGIVALINNDVTISETVLYNYDINREYCKWRKKSSWRREWMRKQINDVDFARNK